MVQKVDVLRLNLDQIAGERIISTTDPDLNIQAAVPQWKYSIVDHADTSPVAISSGVPAIIGKVWCTEAFSGTPDIALYDDTTELYTLNNAMAVRDTVTVLEGTWCETDLNVVIAGAGSAGKVIIQYWPLG